MARLRVRLRGKPVYDITLDESQAYIAGRREDCEIVLQPEKGISREHFRLSFAEGSWKVEVVSRYGEVLFDGASPQHFNLQHGSQFLVPPYEFDFSQTTENTDVASRLPAVASPEERTVIGVAPTIAYIKVLDAQNEAQEIIRLDEGDLWLAGRDSSCHIQIRDQRVSRRQFEIRRVGTQHLIMDLGSVNGTLVNGVPLSSTDPLVLRSGDAISVLTNYLYFELHDANYQSRLEMVKVEPPGALIQDSGYEMVPAPASESLPLSVPVPVPMGMPIPMPMPMPPVSPSGLETSRFDFQKNRPKVIGAAVLLLAIAYLFAGEKKDDAPTPVVVAAPGSPQDAFSKLKPEEQALIRQRYKDAKNLYMQGKYQLAQDEIVKIQSLVPDYEDTKEIERLSKEAIFIQEQQRRQEQVEQARVEAEEKIQKQVDLCQKRINPTITIEEMDECLSSVMQFNPEHPRIIDLKTQVDSLRIQREAKAAERAAYQAQVAKLRAIYEKAQSVHKMGKPLEAIAAYKKVLGASLPDPNGLKSESERSIASIRTMMNSKTASLQAEAEKFYQAQNLKSAILALRKARALDPDNPDLPEKIESYTLELRKNMMTIYQEGILEESFGNVEGGETRAGAKEKWRKILELDIPDGEYYKKAYIKLKKYGAL